MKVSTTTLQSMTQPPKPHPDSVVKMRLEQEDSARRYGWSRDVEQAIKLKWFPDPSTRP